MSARNGALPGIHVRRQSTAQQVATAIREQLVSGEVAPGTRLSDQALAASLQVSRNTVREAMQILASEGLVQQNFHHGVSVADLDLDELADVYRVRRVLELAGVRAAKTARPGWQQELASARDDMAVAADRGDMRAVLVADRRFHEAIVATLASRRISQFYQLVQTEIRLTRTWYGERLSPSVFYRRHADIADALINRKYAQAERLVNDLIDSGETRLRALLEPHKESLIATRDQ